VIERPLGPGGSVDLPRAARREERAQKHEKIGRKNDWQTGKEGGAYGKWPTGNGRGLRSEKRKPGNFSPLQRA
jgi:hypothetical protein